MGGGGGGGGGEITEPWMLPELEWKAGGAEFFFF